MLKKKWKLGLASVILMGLVAQYRDEPPSPGIYKTLRGSENRFITNIFIPHSLTVDSQRALSLNLGGGNCEWQEPRIDVPVANDFHKTILVGYPSGDKRMIFQQMEALTGWPAKDEWDFKYQGMSNHPFIKANYPHHEGIWGWGSAADQVAMVVRNIRRSMVEYHDILWDIGYAQSWEKVAGNLDKVYSTRPPIDDFYEWRDLRVLEEISWYGWFIDYWMEGGLLRDVVTHKLTTSDHWNMFMLPHKPSVADLDFDTIVGADTVVTPEYDPHCSDGEISGGCEPVAVISAEKLRDVTDGPAETAIVANLLLNDDRTGNYVIAQEAWGCIWRELIENGKGLKTVNDRPGYVEDDYNFSEEMLEVMVNQLDRLITKYSGTAWSAKAAATRLVSLITEHRDLIQGELDEVKSGTRALSEKDFLGPKERERKRQTKAKNTPEGKPEVEDFSEYFTKVEEKMLENKRQRMRDFAREAIHEKVDATAGEKEEVLEFLGLDSKESA